MTEFKVNFSDVEEFEPLPAGVYNVVVTDFSENEGPSAPYISYTFEVLDGEFAKRLLWDNLSMSPKAAFKVKEALIAFGEPEDKLTGDFDFNPEMYVGVECRAAVIQEPYQGKTVNRIDSLLPLKDRQSKSGTTTRRPKIT